jgi:transketolase
MIYLYDDNHISIDGSTNLAFTEDRGMRFEAYGWHVQKVADGNDVEAIDAAIQIAKADPRPSIIMCRTTIGFGSPNRQGTSKAHGEPLGDEELALAKQNLGWPVEPRFFIPEDVLEFFREAVERGRKAEEAWNEKFSAYQQDKFELAAELDRRLKGELPADWQSALPTFPADAKGMATRASSGKVINALAAKLPELLGGSADLAPSNNTKIDGFLDFEKETPQGRNFHFGVREHAMAAALNGMALFGGLIPYGGTFLVFSDYNRPAIRIAALSHIPSIFIFTHDSIGLGEDGPTHQPVEHLAALRAIPNLTVIRPADANEVSAAWKFAIENRHGPTVLALTRQNVPTFEPSNFPTVERGAYVLKDFGENPKVILMASGSEVGLIYFAAEKLAEENIAVRVVSFPSWELFEKQDAAYRESVLPKSIQARVAVEAGVRQGWDRYASTIICMESYGASAPAKILFEKFGFTVENVIAKAKSVLAG